jgi:predicted nucleotidyltransferase
MRLDPEIVPHLVKQMRQVYGMDADVWLFGSRTDDNAKGGDIDLYVETADGLNPLDRLIESRSRLFKLFGEQKIDLLVHVRGREPSPMERIARNTGIKLSDIS